MLFFRTLGLQAEEHVSRLIFCRACMAKSYCLMSLGKNWAHLKRQPRSGLGLARPHLGWTRAQQRLPRKKQLPSKLDDGERAAIALAIELRASLLLMDDRAAVEEARLRGLQVTGTLGVLLLAASRGIVDLETTFLRLQSTNFYYSPAFLETLLAAWRKERGK